MMLFSIFFFWETFFLKNFYLFFSVLLVYFGRRTLMVGNFLLLSMCCLFSMIFQRIGESYAGLDEMENFSTDLINIGRWLAFIGMSAVAFSFISKNFFIFRIKQYHLNNMQNINFKVVLSE